MIPGAKVTRSLTCPNSIVVSFRGVPLFTGGYGSPLACAIRVRRSISALVGRPRFRGGSPTVLSALGGIWTDVRLSGPGNRALGGLGCIARGADFSAV